MGFQGSLPTEFLLVKDLKVEIIFKQTLVHFIIKGLSWQWTLMNIDIRICCLVQMRFLNAKSTQYL